MGAMHKGRAGCRSIGMTTWKMASTDATTAPESAGETQCPPPPPKLLTALM